MTSFTSIPYQDIVTLLEIYNQPISENKIDNYQSA